MRNCAVPAFAFSLLSCVVFLGNANPAVGVERIEVMSMVDLQKELSLSGFHLLPQERAIPIQNTAINLNAGAGIAGNAPALAAFNRAAQNWQNVLGDPVVLNINIDMASLGSGILGSTSAAGYYSDFNTIRDLVSGGADTGSAAEAATLAYLPTGAQFSAYGPSGFSLSGNMAATRANLLALGVPQSDMGGLGTSDGSITFSTNFTWDYDNSNGITPGAFSFESVATHEIGHVLGFVSEVDYVDYVLNQGETASLDPSPLDLFRFSSGDVPTTSAAFTTNIRDLVPGGTDYFSYVNGTIQMATGQYFGDGRQASHWKDLLGLGIMDPTLAPGEISLIGNNDLVAMDLIGWQVVPEPGTLVLLVTAGLGLLAYAWRRRRS
jgi:hypothetical protein